MHCRTFNCAVLRIISFSDSHVMKATHLQDTEDNDGLKSALSEAFWKEGESVCVFASHLRWLFPKGFPGRIEQPTRFCCRTFCGCRQSCRLIASQEERVVREITTLKASVSSVEKDADLETELADSEVTGSAAAAVTTRREAGETSCSCCSS
ncbi:hypothetical protein T08_11663 [Trichinella sp. T8]|nr:hypothetical protein T08_11663 [Trichinella sp. T8]